MALQGSHDPVGAEGSGADGRKPDLRSWKVAGNNLAERWGWFLCTLNPVCQLGGPIRQAMETWTGWIEANRLRREAGQGENQGGRKRTDAERRDAYSVDGSKPRGPDLQRRV